jgi:hypothetical protein
MPFIWFLSVSRDEKIIKIYRQRYNSIAREWVMVGGGGRKGSRDHAIWDQFHRGVPVRRYQETCPASILTFCLITSAVVYIQSQTRNELLGKL